MEVVQTTNSAAVALAARRRYFPAISWGGIVAGIIVGLAIQIVLTLLGMAAGLTALGLGTTPPAGEVPAWVGAWQSVSVLIAAFVGGYVAARMSGLQRKTDGMLHGLVAWGATTLLVAMLTTSAVGALFGRALPTASLAALGNGTEAAAAETSPELKARLDELLGNATAQSRLDAQATAQTMQQLQQHVQNGDRLPAIDLLVRTTGMPEDQATAIVDDALAFVASPLSGSEVAGSAPEAVSVVSWWVFGAAIVSMLLGIIGGLAGAIGTRRMRSADDRLDRMASA